MNKNDSHKIKKHSCTPCIVTLSLAVLYLIYNSNSADSCQGPCLHHCCSKYKVLIMFLVILHLMK